MGDFIKYIDPKWLAYLVLTGAATAAGTVFAGYASAKGARKVFGPLDLFEKQEKNEVCAS